MTQKLKYDNGLQDLSTEHLAVTACQPNAAQIQVISRNVSLTASRKKRSGYALHCAEHAKR
jgi:hypothetical protein